MRSICLLVVALALLSVSNQQLASFGNFIQGHEGRVTTKRYSTIKSSSAAVTKITSLGRKVLVTFYSSSKIMLEVGCSYCIKLPSKSPACEYNKCTTDVAETKQAFEDAKSILFSKEFPKDFSWGDNVDWTTSKGYLALHKF